MPRFKYIDGVRRQMTAEEEAQRDSDEEQATIDKQAKIDAQTALEANKTSGKAKLKAGEALNDAELSALFGD